MKKQQKQNPTIWKKICPHCGTEVISIYPKQLEYNFKQHVENCSENPENAKE